MRAWIEMAQALQYVNGRLVALFMRAWIEISFFGAKKPPAVVALFMRAWIEIAFSARAIALRSCRPLHEGVD